MTTDTNIKADLFGYADSYKSAYLNQRIFGELVKLAAPILQHYHSDLYYDARWIDSHLPNSEGDEEGCGGGLFYFAADPWGTSIGEDWELVKLRAGEGGAAWEISVYRDDKRRWFFEALLMIDRRGEAS